MRLGFVNLSDLAFLLWKSNVHFKPLQDFLKDYLVTIYKEQHGVGVISGCELTAEGALTVRTAAGVVLFDNDELVKVEETDVTLDTADLSNPRLDRLELIHSIVSTVQVVNTLNETKDFDKLQTGTPAKSTGTPAVSPVVNAKTANAISLGIISVGTGQVSLNASDINQNDVSRDNSRAVDNSLTVEDILNNQSGTFIPFMIADKSKYRKRTWEYVVHRKTDTGSSGVINAGTLIGMLNPETNNWDTTDDQRGNDDIGVDLVVDPTTGQVIYDSTDISGLNYVGKIHHTSTVVEL